MHIQCLKIIQLYEKCVIANFLCKFITRVYYHVFILTLAQPELETGTSPIHGHKTIARIFFANLHLKRLTKRCLHLQFAFHKY